MKINVKKEDIEKFNNSEIGKIKNAYLRKSMIIGVILIMFSLFWIILDIYNSVNSVFDYVYASIILLFGIFFIIRSVIIKKKEVNKFIYEKKSKK